MLEIASDVAHIINALYIQVKQSDPVQAMFFREAITRLAVSEKSPLWEVQGEMTGICFSVPNNSKEDM